MSVGATVLSERIGEVALVRLNRPAVLNAMTTQLVDELAHMLGHVQADDGVGAVILTGQGRGFCSGEDLRAAAAESAAHMTEFVERLQDATRVLLDMDKPIIAAVNGPAVGGGAELAMACDVRLVGESAFFRFPEAMLGIICTGGTLHLLSEMLGRGRATGLLLTGRDLSSQEAVEIGFASESVADHLLLDRSLEWAQLLASRPRPAVKELKAGLRRLARKQTDAAMDIERSAAARLYAKTVSQEQASAFTRRGSGRSDGSPYPTYGS